MTKVKLPQQNAQPYFVDWGNDAYMDLHPSLWAPFSCHFLGEISICIPALAHRQPVPLKQLLSLWM